MADLSEKLYSMWLQSKAQPAPRYFHKIKESGGYNTTYLKPEDASRFINADDIYDLLRGSHATPFRMDYPTIGFNYKSTPFEGDKAKERFNVLSSENSPKYGLMDMYSLAKQYPRNMPRQYIPQAVYEHEKAHYDDKRTSFKNKGYLQYRGLPGEVASREAPAMEAEDEFWQRLKRILERR